LSNPLINPAFTSAVFGIVGWKNNGKTTLVVRLVEEFVKRGLRVATLKHAHHDFNIDREGTDSWRHAQAGSGEVAIVSSKRWALIHNNAMGEDEPDLAAILAKFEPCDLVLIEGYKQGRHPKLEVHRQEGYRGKQGEAFLATTDPHIIAIASDTTPLPDAPSLPLLDLNAITTIADFIENNIMVSHKKDTIDR